MNSQSSPDAEPEQVEERPSRTSSGGAEAPHLHRPVITDLDEFQRRVGEVGRSTELWFRGHRDFEWKLESPWERRLQWLLGVYADRKKPEDFDHEIDGVFERFRENVQGCTECDAAYWEDQFEAEGVTKELGYEILGRHHGLTTRLLDWTADPLIALYFAFEEHMTDLGSAPGVVQVEAKDRPDAAVWALDVGQLRDVSPTEIELIRTCFSPNQKAQKGTFTRLTSADHFDLESLLTERSLQGCLTEFVFPSYIALKARPFLRAAGVTGNRLFPGLDGCAREANLLQ